MLEAMLVIGIVLVAVVYATTSLLPNGPRQRLAARLAARLELQAHRSRTQRFLLHLLRKPSAGCSDCGARGKCPVQRAAPPARGDTTERVVVIGRS